MEWQDIETAPKSGKVILAWFPATEHTFAKIGLTYWRINYGGNGLNPPHWADGSISGNPTHWMPLPPPPHEEA